MEIIPRPILPKISISKSNSTKHDVPRIYNMSGTL